MAATRTATGCGWWSARTTSEDGQSRPDGVQEGAQGRPAGHVVLGDGAIRVGLDRLCYVDAWEDGAHVDLDALVRGADERPAGAGSGISGYTWHGDAGAPDGTLKTWPVAIVLPEGTRLDVVFTTEDQRYVYARVEQPDGVVWTGFSGYAVGAGHDTDEGARRTADRVATLARLWPGNAPVEARTQSG